MQDPQQDKLDEISQRLATINRNMLKVFWIVTVFALLYFGLMTKDSKVVPVLPPTTSGNVLPR